MKTYEFTFNLKLKDLKFEHHLSKFFPHGEEIIFKSSVINDFNKAVEISYGFSEEVMHSLNNTNNINLSISTEFKPLPDMKEFQNWGTNEVLKIWLTNNDTNTAVALSQVTEL